jgi:hypothetical protein
MLFAWLQIVVLTALIGYFLSVLNYLHRRNQQSWESLTAQLGTGSDPASPILWIESLTAEALWPPLHDLSSLRLRFRNARIALEIADYIERNALPESLASHWQSLQDLRRDAMKIRLEAMQSLPRYAFSS